MPVQLLEVPDKIDKCDFLLKWEKTRDNGASITKYTVYQRTVNESDQAQRWRNVHSSLACEYHVLNLERGELYEFKVTATNKVGEGMEDEQYFKKVEVEAAAPMPVQLLEVPDKIDKCDFLLKWEKTRDNGASITKYTVYQRTVNESDQAQRWRNVHSSLACEYHVLNLERGELYEFKVTATNKVGEGMEDEQYFKKVEVEAAAPMPVQLLEVPDKIDKCDFLLKWEKTRDNGASITKYTVYQRTVNESDQAQRWRNVHSSLACEYHVLNLERGELYEFKVTATNKVGEGMEDEQYFKKVKVEAEKKNIKEKAKIWKYLFLILLAVVLAAVVLWCFLSAVAVELPWPKLDLAFTRVYYDEYVLTKLQGPDT
ncbi:twitchin-like [Orbicella faveolata]|uniref:twitchin-like n=1 Tax=Orbicella faveolata TaxID=48498 RepID=UPI0009E42252|nr:twitchin-like [Orbicella faveolata]